jgi:hypothetical protein
MTLDTTNIVVLQTSFLEAKGLKPKEIIWGTLGT